MVSFLTLKKGDFVLFSMDCLFCDRKHETVCDDILYESENFYVKGCLASVALGHVLLISKEHYSCYGALSSSLDDEFFSLKERLIHRVRDTFSEPFLLEHGVWGQSVAHAHLHCIPLSGVGYTIDSIFEKLIFPSGVRFLEGSLEIMREVYTQDGAYFYVEERGKGMICDVRGLSHETLGFRHFFQRMGLDVPLLWKNATDEQKNGDLLRRRFLRTTFRL